MKKNLKIGLVHDWLVSMRGGEKVFEVFCELFPDAVVGTLVHRKGYVSSTIESHIIKTSFLQKLPYSSRKYQYYLPLFPSAIENLDFSDYDVVISSSHAVAKGVKTGKDTLHICYCHTPMRYIWDQYENYFDRERSSIFIRTGMKISLPYLRQWDINSSRSVNYFIANSKNVQNRIQRLYKRDADVIYPPVDTSRFNLSKEDEGYFLIVSALVPYKRIDIAIEAFNLLGYRLVIAGSGQEEQRLKLIAKSNIEFAGWVDDKKLIKLYSGCRALVFPGEEDFGIVPVEAMAAGKPVIAYEAGGALETVVQGVTGIFFKEQNPEAICNAVKGLVEFNLNPEIIRSHALNFDKNVFRKKVEKYINEKMEEWGLNI